MKKILRIFKLSVRMYSVLFKRNLYLTVSIAVSLLLFLAVSLYMDFQYANYVKSYNRIQNNYIAVAVFGEDTLSEIEKQFKDYHYIRTYYGAAGGTIINKENEYKVEYNVIGEEKFYSDIFIRSNLENGTDIANSQGFEKYTLLCGRDSFNSRYEIIISEEYAHLFADNPADVLGMQLSLGYDGSDQIFTVVGVYKAILTETRINKVAYLNLNSGIESDEPLRYTVITSSDMFNDRRSINADLYVFFRSSEEKNDIINKLTILSLSRAIDPGSLSFLTPDYIRVDLDSEYAYSTGTKALIMLIVAVISGISVFGTMQNSIADRKKEIGIKKALGASDGDIMLGFMIENVLNALIAMLISISLASLVSLMYCIYMRKVQLVDYAVWVYPSTVILFICFAFSSIIGFSLLPAYHATQIEIVDTIRDE